MKFVYTMLYTDPNRSILTESNSERDFGILVSNNLSWEVQINSAVSKASRSLGLQKSTLKNIDYGVNVWSPCLKKRINKWKVFKDEQQKWLNK